MDVQVVRTAEFYHFFTISLPKFRFLAERVALFVKKVRVWGRERLGGDDASYTLPGKTSVQV
jgi:hypothetical protein